MKTKLFDLLLGTSLMFMMGAGIFSAFDAKADEPINQKWYLNQSTNDWCEKPGNNCLDTVIITPGSD